MLIVFISFVGTSMAYPIFPPLFLETKQSIIPIDWSLSTRSLFLGLALAAFPLGQFLGSPVLGSCSDYYGRKKILMMSLIGSAIGYSLSMLSLQCHLLWLLFISRFITGFMEGNFAIVRAMATDLTSINKYKSIGRINAFACMGYIMGPLFGGVLSDSQLSPWFSFSLPFFMAMLLSGIVVLLAGVKLPEKKAFMTSNRFTIIERFNLIKNFKILFSKSEHLKYLLIISTLFTFAVDMFYEFGPVYLTGFWGMGPSGIAIYSAILSFTLAIGSIWLPYYLSFKLSLEHVIAVSLLITGFIFILLVFYSNIFLSFILFGLVGLSIATANTNFTIQVSNAVDASIQGEALGAQLSLRTLGDAIICLIGGVLVMSSFVLPLLVSSVMAFLALIFFKIKFMNKCMIKDLSS